MEKPKRKDGMLAAGKKRLEQFREKKQGKGSASKNVKPETDLEHGRLGFDSGGRTSSKGNKSRGSTHHSSSDDLEAERASSGGNKAKGSVHHTLSDNLEAANARSESGINEIPIDLKVARADDTDSQINAEHIPASVLDHGSAHAFNSEENDLEQCRETGEEKLIMGNSELCLRIDSLEASGLDVRGSPPITGYLKAPVESELLVGGSDSSSVSVAPDLSINMADLVAPNINVNHGLANHGDGTTELNGERVVMKSSCSDHAEAVQACDKEQESMGSVEFSEDATRLCLMIEQPVVFTAEMNTEHSDEKASELHVDAKHFQEAGSEYAASSQDLISLQSTSRGDEKDTSRPEHDLDSGAAGFNTTSANLEHMGVATQVENREQNLSSSCDTETGTDYLTESKSKSEVDFDTDVADPAHLTVSGTEVHLSPISEIPIVADAVELHCTGEVMGLGSDGYSNMEQPQNEELDDSYSGNNLIGMPSDSNVGLCLNEECGLKAATDDSYQDGMPVVLRQDMTSIDGGEVTVLDVSEPADQIVGLNCVEKTALLGELADDSCIISEDAISVSPKIDGTVGKVSLVHVSEEGLNSNVISDQNPETDVEGGSTSSGFHEIIEAGVNSRDSVVNTEWTTAVEPDWGAMSVHVGSIVNPIQESEQATTREDQILKTTASSTDGGVGSAAIMEVEEIVTPVAFHHTTQEAHIPTSVGSAAIMDMEEMVTSVAFHHSTQGAHIPESGVADITIDTASAKIEVECNAALKPEVVTDKPLDLGAAPSVAFHHSTQGAHIPESGVADITIDTASAKIEVECNAALKPEVGTDEPLDLGAAPSVAFHLITQGAHIPESGSGVADITIDTASAKIEVECNAALKPEVDTEPLDLGVAPSVAFHLITQGAHIPDSGSGVADITIDTASKKIEVECNAALKPEVDTDELLDLDVTPSEKSEEVQGTVEEVMNKGPDRSTGERVFQLMMDKVVEECGPGQNLIEDVTISVMKMEPSSDSNTTSLNEEIAGPELLCCNEELYRTQVSLESEIDEPDIAPHVVAVDNSFSNSFEVGDALSGGSYMKHRLDTFAVDAEMSLSDNVLSRNGYSEHKSEIFPSAIKDDLPVELLSRAVVHDHEADFTNQSHSSLDSGQTLDSNCAENKAHALASDGTLISGNGEEFVGRNSERGKECTEVSQFEPAMQSCSESKAECDSITLESCKSYEVVSLVGEIALPLVVSPDETLEKEAENLSLKSPSQDIGADANQNGNVGLSFENAQEGHSLPGQLSRSFNKSYPPFENVQGHTWTGQKSRGFDESTLIEEAGLRNEINLALTVGVSQHVEDEGVEEQSRFNKTGRGNEGEAEAENVIRQLREALSMKETEMALLLNSEHAKNSEEQDMANRVLTHVVTRLGNLVSQGSSVNEDGDFHIQHLRPFDVDNGGTELINLDYFLQACSYWMDELQKDLEEKRQTEIMRRQLEEALLMKDNDLKGLTEKVKELSQNCDELQKDSEQMKDLKSKAMQLEEQLKIKDSDVGRLSDKVSKLSQNCDVAMDEAAKAVDERVNLEGELKYFQKLYAEQETKASQLEELLSIKDADLERLFNKIAELSQNYDLAMGEVAKSAEERLSLAGELNHFQRLSAEQEEGRLRMCMQASALADKISALLSPSSIAVEAVHDDAIDTLENLVASLQRHYDTVCRESKDLLLRANDSDATHQVEVDNLRALVSAKEVELLHLREKVDSLTNELSKTREDGEKKVQEAEQKAIGVRERLSLAVTKGKGLVQQRDNLKQLLAEKTAEFETLASSFKQELHLKTVALNEAEIKAKLNSEAVERVEALESELSYIRNSANALRESFLQKDAVLQKIEELLEDANLPGELQIKDTYEKVEWLLEAQPKKTSILEGQDHSETVATREMNAFSVAEQASQMQEIDHLNRKCDELLRKYRGMAEQSAMLEQSLLERNLLIQRWEEMLDAVDMPATVRLKEPEDKIGWLGTTICDAHTSIAQFQAETESLQKTIEALNNALQKLQEENVVLSVELTAKDDELRTVALGLEDMTVKYNSLSTPTYERSNDIGMPLSQAGLRGLEESELKQEVLQQPQFLVEDSEAFVTNIRTLLSEIMQEDEVNNIFSGVPAGAALESSVKLLVENSKVWSTEATEAKGKLAELTLAMKENDREKELESLHEALSSKTLELSDVTMQFEGFAMKNSLLEDEVDNLQKEVKVISEDLSSARDELSKSQLEASQLEDKLASTREKLSMAVKKGKSVVQQRDALKQSLDEKTTELSQIRKEQEAENLAFTKAKQSLKQQLQQVEMLEAELLSSRNYASSLEKSMQESNRAIQKFAEALDKISISGAPRSGDLVEKIQWISQLVLDLQRKAGISEQEAKKSKKSTELLALELEEVQGRMDSLADELMHAEKNISLLIEEKKSAEASKAEAGLRLEHAMANINSLLFELSESRENLANLDQENNSLKDALSAQMEEIRYKQTKAEDQLKDLTDLYNKVHHLKANQSTFLGMVADQVFNSVEDAKGTKNLVLRVSGELKDQGFISLLAAPVFADISLSKWQPEKTIQEWKQGVTTGSLKLLCDEMETELQHFYNFFKSFATVSNQDSIAISQLLMEICDGLGPLSQKMQNLKRDADFASSTESLILQKDEQIRVLEEVLKAVTERLKYSIEEMEVFKEEAQGQVSQSGASAPHLVDGRVPYKSFENLQALTFSLVERLLSTAKDLAYSHQEDYIQKEKQNENLRSQLSKARAAIDAMEHEQQVDKLKLSELQKCLEEFEVREEILKRTNQELYSLSDVLSTKKQEEGRLVEALNSAETKIGELSAKVEELEKAKQELEASLGKASSRFYTTFSNFNKFQSLSEKLIEEAESLHLLLEDRDAQISLLKEEVALKGSEVTSLQNLISEKTNDLSQLYQKIGEIVNRDAGSGESFPDSGLESQTGSRKELLEALATSVRAGTEGLRVQLARKDALLQDVQLRHDDLARKVSVLESSLLENQRLIEERGYTSVTDRMMISVEAEDKGNRGKHVTPSVAVVTHGRGGRKVSAPSDHLALDVDTESSRLLADMDDEDKGHVFKPLTSSRLVPRGTRILVDRVDGLWVSGERLLRRRPGARLSVMLYWIVLHVWMVAIFL